MSASFHQGLFDLDTDRRLFEEMIARKVVDELRAVHDGQLLCVRRTTNGIAAEITRDDALLRIFADLEHGCRSFDLTYEQWDRYFHDIKVFVPGLRIPRFRFEFRTHADLARQVFEDEHVSLVQLEDEMRAVSEQIGGRTKVPEHESYLLPADRLLAFCWRQRLVCRISP